MKKLTVLFIFICLFFFVSCNDAPVDNKKQTDDNKDDNTEIKEEKNYNAKLLTNDIIMALDEVYNLELEKDDNSIYSFEYDSEYLKILDDKIIPTKVGLTTVSLVINEKVEKTINVLIYEAPASLHFIDLPKEMKTGDEILIKLNTDDVIISINNDNATFDSVTNILKAINPGEIEITGTYKYDNNISITKRITIIDSVVDATNVLVDSDIKAEPNEEVVLDGVRYIFGINLFNTISDALTKENTIYLNKTEEESITISKDGITLIGDSDDKNDLVINIASNVKDIKIEGITFTGDSKIKLLGNNSNIIINNNEFIDTTKTSNAWSQTNSYKSGIIELVECNTYHDNIMISDNSFSNIGECGINVNTTHNISFKNNKFNGFYRDGIRLNNGKIIKDSVWEFINNSFIDSNYSGIYFRTYASDSSEIYHYIDIKENYFSALGKSGEEFSGAVVFRNYQEGLACVDISYNIFNNCSRFIFLRNNAVAKNQNNFIGYVTGNVFETVPAKYYFNNLNSSDTVSTNPKQAILTDNAYLDGEGNDIVPNDSLFIGAKKNRRIKYEKINSLYHFDLHHVMQVDKVYTTTSTVTSVDSGVFSISGNLIKPLQSGSYVLTHGEDTFEVTCIKKIELVVKFINIALGEVGYQEFDANGNTGTSGNYTKYGEWYGINPGAWCAMFVSWCANQAGVSTSIIPKYASVQIGMDWYKDKGLFRYKESYTPKAGDIMFMKSNGASHTGIVLYCDGNTLYTVEGNTNDCCACRKYDVNNAKITGYGLPQWPYYSPNGYNFSDGKAQDGSGNKTT